MINPNTQTMAGRVKKSARMPTYGPRSFRKKSLYYMHYKGDQMIRRLENKELTIAITTSSVKKINAQSVKISNRINRLRVKQNLLLADIEYCEEVKRQTAYDDTLAAIYDEQASMGKWDPPSWRLYRLYALRKSLTYGYFQQKLFALC